MLTTIPLDGQTTEFQFNWPYLDRTHIMVTVDAAPRPFKFLNDTTIRVVTLFGEPLPAGGTLKIFRVTPDTLSFLQFTDAANLTAADLNRCRLQLLFLIQERAGGLAGGVGAAVQLVTNEIETISGALDSLAVSMGILMSGLQTLDELQAAITRTENEALALRGEIAQAIADFDSATGDITVRMDSIEAKHGSLQASVSSQIATLASADFAQASRVDAIEASLSGPGDDDDLSAALIEATIATVKGDVATVKRIESLEARGPGGAGSGAAALVQQEREARVSADEALAHQITTVQATINHGLAQVTDDIQATADAVGNLQAQRVIKAGVVRADGKTVMAGIGLSASNIGGLLQSEIILMGDRLVFVDSNNTNGPLQPMFVAGNVDGSPTFIVPSQRLGDRTYPGRILVDGSVEGRSAKFDTFTGDHMKVGSITARELNVDMGVNLLANSTFIEQAPWGTYDPIGGGCTFSIDGGGADWRPLGGHVLTMYQPHDWYQGNESMGIFWISEQFPVKALERYGFSVATGAHRCHLWAYIEFHSADGAYVGGSPVPTPQSRNAWEAAGGRALSGYKRLYGFAAAPATAATCQLVLRKQPTLPGYTDSFGFFAEPMVCVVTPNQTRPPNYGPSGLGTYVTPAGVRTPSLSALSPNAGLIVNGKLVSADGQMTIDLDNKHMQMARAGRRVYMGPDGMYFGPATHWDPKLYYSTDTDQLTLKGVFTADSINAVNTLNVAGGAITAMRYGETGSVSGTYLAAKDIQMDAGSTGTVISGTAQIAYTGGSIGSWPAVTIGIYRDYPEQLLGTSTSSLANSEGVVVTTCIPVLAYDPTPNAGWTTYSVRRLAGSAGSVTRSVITLIGGKR